MANYQPQRSIPSENVWEKRLIDQSTTVRQQQSQQQSQQHPTKILKRNQTENNATTMPKSAPAVTSSKLKSNFSGVTTEAAKTEKEADATKTPIPQEKPTLLQSNIVNPLLPSLNTENKMPTAEINSSTKILGSAVSNETVTTTTPALSINSLLLRAIQESKQFQKITESQPIDQSTVSDQQQMSQNALPPSSFPAMQHSSTNSSVTLQQLAKTFPTQSLQKEEQSQQPIGFFESRQHTWENPMQSTTQNTFFAQAIESMSRAPPASLFSTQSEQQVMKGNLTQPQSLQQQSTMSILQRAIQQSDQQLNISQPSTSIPHDFTNVTPFQPFDLIAQNAFTGFPLETTFTQPPHQHHQQQQQLQQPSNQSASIPIATSQPVSSPSMPPNSPSSQSQTTLQTNSPRTPGGSTLQFVPSQVLRKMSKSHK